MKATYRQSQWRCCTKGHVADSMASQAAERDSADSIDELVKRNIQDVLQAANVHAGDYEDDTGVLTIIAYGVSTI